MALAHLFNHPVPSALLLALAFLGLVVEIRSVGFHRAGWAGLLALALFFTSHVLEGAPLWSPVLAAIGIVVVWPALSDPGRRVPARLGILLTAAGAYAGLLQGDPASLDHARAAAVLASAGFLVLLVGSLLWLRLPASERPSRRSTVFFHQAGTDAGGREPGLEGPRRGAGTRGTVVTALRPQGHALLAGEVVEVATEGDWIEEGEEIEVVNAEGVHPLVRPVARET